MKFSTLSHAFLHSPVGTSMCTDDYYGVSVAVAVTVSTTVVAFVYVTATGAVVLHCTVGRQSSSNCRPCPKSPEETYV